MRNKKICISQAKKEQNQLEIEYLAKQQECQLLEASIDWLTNNDYDILEFKDLVSEVLIERLRLESIKNNVVIDDSPDKRSNLCDIFLEL